MPTGKNRSVRLDDELEAHIKDKDIKNVSALINTATMLYLDAVKFASKIIDNSKKLWTKED